MPEIPATWMRGGTSKCWVFRREDLHAGDLSLDEILLRLYGSPDHRQVDGVGGGTSTTSKAVILEPSTAEGVDVDYTFAQVGTDVATVDWGSNCGNCSAVVAAFSIAEGWVTPEAPETTVRVRNTNTDQLIVQHVPTPGGRLTDDPTTAIPGVPFLGAPVRMGFVDPAGRTTGRLFPTGARRDVVGTSHDTVEVTMVDAGAPVVAVAAASLGLTDLGSPAELDAVPGLLARLDRLRRTAGVRMGLAATPDAVPRAVPKLAVVAPPAEGRTGLAVRMLSMGRFHPAVPITGSVALSLAAAEPGTVPAEAAVGDTDKGLLLETPAGPVQTFVEDHDGAVVVGTVRTYRRLARASLSLPDAPAAPRTHSA